MLWSALIGAAALTLVGLGIWLIVRHGARGLLISLAPLGVALLMRPRLGRLSTLLRRAHRLSPAQAPALHALVDRIVAATGAPRPDVILVTRWPAIDGIVVGLRRTKVLRLGLPLLVALAPQEQVALIGRALGAFTPVHTRRALQTAMGRAFFRGLGGALRPAPIARDTPSARLPLGWLVWQFVGYVLWAPLWTMHLAVSALDARNCGAGVAGGPRGDARRGHRRPAGRTQRTGALAVLRRDGQRHRPHRQRADRVASTNPVRARHPPRRSRRVAPAHRPGRRIPAARPAAVGAPLPVPRQRAVRRPQVVVSPPQAARIDAELSPYAEALRDHLAEAYEMRSNSPGVYASVGADAVMWSVAPWLSLLGRTRTDRAVR